MKSILFYISRYPGFGGIEKVTTTLANYWAETLGWKVAILSHHVQDIELLSQLSKNVFFSKVKNENNILSNENIEQINKIICERGVKNVIYQDSYIGSYPLLYHIPTSINIIVVEHNTPDCSWQQYKFRWYNEKPYNLLDVVKKVLYPYYYVITKFRVCKMHTTLYELCNHYVLLSEKYIPVFVKWSKCKKTDKCLYINNPVTGDIAPSLPDKHNQILFLSRLDIQKGVMKMLEIWKDLYGSFPEWKLCIVGDGPMRDQMESYIYKHSIQNVSFMGYRHAVDAYLQASSMLCMTSIYEGWPLTEYSALRIPAVAVKWYRYFERNFCS